MGLVSRTRIAACRLIGTVHPTAVVVPYSSAAGSYPPITVPVTCNGKSAVAVIDQVRAIAKHRLREKIEDAPPETVRTVTSALMQIPGCS
jgi:mRNA-degrading endonuclease toxin of MazEF toxin-antitoxin module